MFLRSFISLSVLAVFFWCVPCDAQIREVRSPFLNDIGQASYDRQGNPIVSINPRRCRQLGPEMCEFVRAHEYAHHYLGHMRNNVGLRQSEIEADAWAARHVSPASSRAAIQYFSAGNAASPIHGSGAQRASRVARSMQYPSTSRSYARMVPSGNARSASTFGGVPQRNYRRVYLVRR